MLDSTIFSLFIERLNSAGIHYVVTGSVAVIVYGEPRMTHDIDMVVELKRSKVPALVAAFPDDTFYCPPEEVIAVECSRTVRGHFNIIHLKTGFKADIYPVGADPFLRWALANAVEFDLSGVPLRVAPPEYVIVKKLEYFREGGSLKHISDIRSMLDNISQLLTNETLRGFVKNYGLEKEWEQVVKDR